MGAPSRRGGSTRDTYTQRKGLVRKQRDSSCLEAKERGFRWNQPCQRFELGVPASTTVGKINGCCLKHQCVMIWYDRPRKPTQQCGITSVILVNWLKQLLAHSDFRKWHSLEGDCHAICNPVLKWLHTVGLLLTWNLFALLLICRLCYCLYLWELCL